MKETAVGVGFGVRGEYYPEDFLTAWTAFRLKLPASWVEDRREHFLATITPGSRSTCAAIAGDREGRTLEIHSEFWLDLGAYVRAIGVRVRI